MKRRTLLGAGGTALAFALAGCLDDGVDPGDDDSDVPPEEGEGEDDGAETPDDADDDPTDGSEGDDDTEDDESTESDDGNGEREDREDPSVVDTEFEVVSEGSGGEDDGEARVDIDGETVRVEGSIVGRNGCYTARLEEAVVEDGTLVVRVEAYEDAEEGEMCTQALVVIEYEARVDLDGEPSEVRVEHDGEAVASEG